MNISKLSDTEKAESVSNVGVYFISFCTCFILRKNHSIIRVELKKNRFRDAWIIKTKSFAKMNHY